MLGAKCVKMCYLLFAAAEAGLAVSLRVALVLVLSFGRCLFLPVPPLTLPATVGASFVDSAALTAVDGLLRCCACPPLPPPGALFVVPVAAFEPLLPAEPALVIGGDLFASPSTAAAARIEVELFRQATSKALSAAAALASALLNALSIASIS